MASPIGHGIIGYTIFYIYLSYIKSKTIISKYHILICSIYFILLANIFDFDYFRLNNWQLNISFKNHHRINHSIIFAMFFWCCVVVLTCFFNRKFRDYWLFLKFSFAAIISHLIIDYICYDSNYTNGIGIPLLYPISKKCFISKLVLFTGLDITNVFSFFNAAILIYEISFAGLIFLLVKKICDKYFI